jgi:hypothetical protein
MPFSSFLLLDSQINFVAQVITVFLTWYCFFICRIINSRDPLKSFWPKTCMELNGDFVIFTEVNLDWILGLVQFKVILTVLFNVYCFLGQPRRHLLTTGWSIFVSQKNLVSGDAVLFLRYVLDNDAESAFFSLCRVWAEILLQI